MKKLITNLKMLWNAGLNVPKQLDRPSMIAYHNHYVLGIMISILAYGGWSVLLLKNLESKWLVFFLTIILSYLTVRFVGWLKEIIDTKFGSGLYDQEDINFTTYGWWIASAFLIPITVFVIFLS